MKRWVFFLLFSFWLTGTVKSQVLHLFSPETRECVGRPQRVVLEFLEHYFRDLRGLGSTEMARRLADDKVFFRQGVPDDLYGVDERMDFGMSLTDNFYEACWKKDGVTLVEVVFPARYDLLLGMDQDMAARLLVKEIKKTRRREYENTRRREDEKTRIQEVREFGGLSNATYYDENGVPMFDVSHPDYAAANLFAGLIEDADYELEVEQDMYGLRRESYSLKLSEWLDYCREWDLDVYFGIEQWDENGMKALVVAHSKELCFNHMLSVWIPYGFTSKKDVVLKVRLTPYIPGKDPS